MSVKIDDLLVTATAHFASDLHLKTGSFPIMRIGGELYPVADAPRLAPEDTLDMAFSMMSNRQKQKLKEVSEVDIAYSVKGLGRFRANIFQQRGTVSIVLRVIPDQSKTAAALGLPPVIDRIAEERRGLILVTGATGSGKSTTLAAMIDRINTTRSGHIVTIEDPIEFLHRDKMAFVTQREVDVDTRSFAEALRGALRQDPDVILVGEMRDLETISTALTAAETGHLVLSTFHTLDATETIMRIVSSFPSHQQKSVRIQLAGILKAVINPTAAPLDRQPRQRREKRLPMAASSFLRPDKEVLEIDPGLAQERRVANAADHLRGSHPQRDESGRVQDARVRNLLDRSDRDGQRRGDELLRTAAWRV